MSTFLNDDLNSESDFTGSRVHTDWADIHDSDDDDGIHGHYPMQRQLSDFPDGKVDSTPEAGPAAVEPGLARALDRKRTPLRSKASSFVPFVPITSRVPVIGEATCCWVPHPLELAHMAHQHGTITTVIMRNLPCGFFRDDLIQAMDAKGFAGFYNLVYLPLDFRSGACLGYAFVNLVTEQDTQRFILDLNGFDEWPFQSAKVCSVELARTQGLMANVERYRNSPVMNEEVPDIFRPVLFDGNMRVPFPEPTRDLPKDLKRVM
jgi:hypothetical protein